MIKDKKCIVCNEEFTPIRSHKTTCSNKCYIKKCRMKKKLVKDFQSLVYSGCEPAFLIELQFFMNAFLDNAQQHTNNQ